ncbi:sulfur carrier protein ThiS [Rubritalea marina]|uniref:sulfur carrier protein ThiS n=1 Tax=Rubritalea marina TaxID=361055 RepID=UPI0003811CF2|nr:sulfur carrier protein ThiS [Rubritalea marina]
MSDSLQVNGTAHPLPTQKTVTGLLKDLGLEGKPVVVERNQSALFPRDYDTVSLKPGDSIEVITIAAGG